MGSSASKSTSSSAPPPGTGEEKQLSYYPDLETRAKNIQPVHSVEAPSGSATSVTTQAVPTVEQLIDQLGEPTISRNAGERFFANSLEEDRFIMAFVSQRRDFQRYHWSSGVQPPRYYVTAYYSNHFKKIVRIFKGIN